MVLRLFFLFLALATQSEGRKTASRPSASIQHNLPTSVISNPLIKTMLLLRGGREDSETEDEYDDEENEMAEEDEATAMHQQRRNQHRQAPKTPPSRPEVDARGRHKAPYIPRKKKEKNPLALLATMSLSLSKKAAVTAVQTSGKAAFYLMRPKSVSHKEIWGIWRLDQQVGLKQATANIELTPRGMVIIRDGKHIIWKAPYRFIEPTWPKMCRVEFEARAFQPANGRGKPWLLFYKGYLERKVADSKVIKMVGKLYEVECPKNMFGKELPVRYKKIGSFVGRKRVMIEDDDEFEDPEGDVFEDDGEEDESRHNGRRRQTPEVDLEDDYYDENEYDDEF